MQGLEHDKWSNATEPEHDVTLPFTRMFLGPMDFTPGAMHNADRAHFKPIFNAPMSLGTRSHQLAMYVVYESPLQMLADSPSNYLGEPEAMEFLGRSRRSGTRPACSTERSATTSSWPAGRRDLVPGRHDRLDVARAPDRHQLPRRRRLEFVAYVDPPDHPAVGSEHYRTTGTLASGTPARFTLAPAAASRPCLRVLRRRTVAAAAPVIFGDHSAISFSVVSLS